MPGNRASVTPATSIGVRSKYVHNIKPIDVISSPRIGISIQGFLRPCLKYVRFSYAHVNRVKEPSIKYVR